MHLKVWFTISLLFAALTSISPGQTFPDEDRVGDAYYEGFRQHKDVSGSLLKLKSFTAHPFGDVADDAQTYSIRFHVPEPLAEQKIKIFIEDREGNYYLKPIREHWPTGEQHFTWDSQKTSSIGLENLFALIKDDEYEDTILPVTFYAAANPASIEWYEFVFIPAPGQSTNVKFTILAQDGGSQTEVAGETFKNQPGNTPVRFKWACKEAPAGRYILQVSYKVGQNRAMKDKYKFYHR